MSDVPHGNPLRYYTDKCRCSECMNARRLYERFRNERSGQFGTRIHTRVTRLHIRRLLAADPLLTCSQIDRLAKLANGLTWAIHTCKVSRIYAATQKKICTVPKGVRPPLGDFDLVDAGPTWKLLDELLDGNGFSLSELARRIGLRSDLQISRKRVRVITARKVKAFYETVMAEDKGR